jgi:hypothetical protein
MNEKRCQGRHRLGITAEFRDVFLDPMKSKALIAQPKVQGALIRECFTAQES